MDADYYWGGVWVPYGDTELICDYWTINNIVFDSDEDESDVAEEDEDQIVD